MFAAIAVVHT